MKPFLVASLLLLFSAVNCLGEMAFVANLEGNWDLFTVDDQGENLTRLTQTPFDEKDPAWSPDKKMLVYATSDGRINIMHVASKETMQTGSEDPVLQKYAPVFAADGNRLAYSQANKELRDDTDLVVYDLRKKAGKIFLNQGGIQMWPAWSPDGKHLAYTSLHCNEACGRFIQELWLADVNGKWWIKNLDSDEMKMLRPFGDKMLPCKDVAW